jgi:1,4-alpha-glucan branching enzyme
MVTITERGTAVFRLFDSAAQRVEVRGSFTQWHANPIAMHAVGEGWWEVEATIAPGDHEFQYLVDGVRWTTDYAASGVRLTRLGTWASLLHVPAPDLETVVMPVSRARSRIAA